MIQKESNNLLWLGTIVNTHGVKGEVRILSNSENKEIRFAKDEILYFYKGEELSELKIASSRPHKQFILVTFVGINNINEIEWIKDTKVYCLRDELEEGEYYLKDLVDLEVIDQNNNVIGIVTSIIDQGPYESLEVKLKNGKSTNIPMVDEFKIKHKDNKVFVDIPIEFIE